MNDLVVGVSIIALIFALAGLLKPYHMKLLAEADEAMYRAGKDWVIKTFSKEGKTKEAFNRIERFVLAERNNTNHQFTLGMIDGLLEIKTQIIWEN